MEGKNMRNMSVRESRVHLRSVLAALLLSMALVSSIGASPASAQTAPPEVTDEMEGSVTRLYLALLDREPDAGGLAFWTDQLARGGSLRNIVAFFRTSPEFEERFGELINAPADQWVDHMYNQVLGRNPDAGGRDYWVEAIESGRLSPEDLIMHFSESPEYRVTTAAALWQRSLTAYGDLDHPAYEYESSTTSMTGSRTTTRVEVLDDEVVGRHYVAFDAQGDVTDEWTETGSDIGSNQAGAPAFTVEEVHEACRVEVLNFVGPAADEVDSVKFSYDDDNLLTGCVYIPTGCVDDCLLGYKIEGYEEVALSE